MARCPGCGGSGGIKLLISVSRCNRCEVRKRDSERSTVGIRVKEEVEVAGSGIMLIQDFIY